MSSSTSTTSLLPLTLRRSLPYVTPQRRAHRAAMLSEIRSTHSSKKSTKRAVHEDVKTPNKQQTDQKTKKLIMHESIHLPFVRAASDLLRRRNALRKEVSDAKAIVGDYNVVIFKDKPLSVVDRELKLIDDEFQALRAVARSALGLRPIHIKLFQAYNQVCDSSGITASATTVDPTPITEFAALAELFDEYKVNSLDYDYVVCNYTGLAAGGSKNSMSIMAFDPTDATVPTSGPNALQLAQSQLTHVPCALNTLAINPGRGLKRFHAHVLSGTLLSNGTSQVTTQSWQPTVPTGAFVPYGYLKTYASTFTLVSGPSHCGILTYHCEFRSRA